METYAIFLYADREIQWTTGDGILDGGTNGLGGNTAQIGFNKGDGVNFGIIPISGTIEVGNVAATSNVREDGVYVFKISDRIIPIVTSMYIYVKYTKIHIDTKCGQQLATHVSFATVHKLIQCHINIDTYMLIQMYICT